MQDDDKLAHLIGLLYEAALEPSCWQAALQSCADYAGAIAAHLLSIDKATNQIEHSLFGGALISEQNTEAYATHYAAIDPRTTSGMMIGAAVNEWRFCHTYLDKRFVSGNEFFQDFLLPNGGRYSMGAWADDNAERHVLLGLHRAADQSPFGANERAAAERFGPHLQRAYRLYLHTQQLTAKADLGARAIDALACAMWIVDGNARVLHLNASAENLLSRESGDWLYWGGKLTCRDMRAAAALSLLLAKATANPAAGGAMHLGGMTNSHALVAPLPAASAFVHDWQRPLALVLVTQDAQAQRWPFDLHDVSLAGLREASPLTIRSSKEEAVEALTGFVRTYRLTAREADVLQGLMDGYSPKEIAESHGVSRNTVRSQLASLMQKTDCRRQKDLVRLFLKQNQ